jgi:hypothetical protein
MRQECEKVEAAVLDGRHTGLDDQVRYVRLEICGGAVLSDGAIARDREDVARRVIVEGAAGQ